MTRAYLSIGSNQLAAANIRRCLDSLAGAFGRLGLSPVYRNPARGFAGDDFLNLVVGIETQLSFDELSRWCRAQEAAQGRVRGGEKFADRTLDLDVLTYGDRVDSSGDSVLPREDILRYPFVLKPLADLAPDQLYPGLGRTYGELWRQMAKAGGAGVAELAPVRFCWRAPGSRGGDEA